jgi:hypothetical protein
MSTPPPWSVLSACRSSFLPTSPPSGASRDWRISPMWIPCRRQTDIARYPVVQVWVEAARLLCAHFGNEVFIRGNCDQCPFALATLVRGMEGWLTDIMDPELEPLAHRLLDYCRDLQTHKDREFSASVRYVE